MFWIIIASFAVLVAVAIMIYMMPAESAKSRKKKERAHPPADVVKPAPADKDWKVIAQRWEKNNNALLADMEKMKLQEKKHLKDLEESKARHKEALDKLALEKGWREKEQVNLDKAKHHEKDLKEQVTRTEKDLEREHSERLRLERELQELKVKHEAASEEKRAAATKAMSLETTVNQMSAELKELRRENGELKKKREDIQWVAKSEFDDLRKQYDQLKQK